MARAQTFAKKKEVVKALKSLDGTSYFLKRQLVEEGYIVPVKDVAAKRPGKGRCPYRYDLTSKGSNLVRLSANWFTKPEAASA